MSERGREGRSEGMEEGGRVCRNEKGREEGEGEGIWEVVKE